VKSSSQFEGPFTLLAAVQEVTSLLLQPLELHQLSLLLLLLLLPLKPQPEGIFTVAGVCLL